MKKNILAFYLRLSLEDMNLKKNGAKDESNSIQNQRNMLSRYVSEHSELLSYEQIEFVDDGYSGTNFDRPNFKKMIDMVRSGEIKCIIVKDLSRFGRNYLEVGDYLEHIFPYLGVRFIAINDEYDSNNYSGTTAGLDVAFRNFVYEQYSRDLSKKVKDSMHMLMKKGAYVNHCPYGYTKEKGVKHKMIPDPETAPIVREIFMMAIKGMKSTEIARELNRRGVATPMEHKKLSRARFENQPMWTHQSILRIIKDYKYTGAMVTFKCENLTIRAKAQYRRDPKDYLIIEGVHEAIVSHDEYYAANETIRKVKSFSHQKSDAKDKVYICGYCGRRLRKTYGSDEYYSCPTQLYVGDAVCSSIKLKRAKIEESLFQAYKTYLEIIADKYVREMQETRADEITPLKLKLKQLVSEASSLDNASIEFYEKYRLGDLTKEEFMLEKGKVSEKRKLYETQIEDVKTQITSAVKRRDEIAERLDNLKDKANWLLRPDEELLQEMYDDIERVIVYSERAIEIIWKFDIDSKESPNV